jgi:hypothetical protein
LRAQRGEKCAQVTEDGRRQWLDAPMRAVAQRDDRVPLFCHLLTALRRLSPARRTSILAWRRRPPEVTGASGSGGDTVSE